MPGDDLKRGLQKTSYDLSNYTLQAGQFNRLAVLNYMPLFPGDELSYSANLVVRFSPLVRQLLLDAQIDILTVYEPHRHCYEDTIPRSAAAGDWKAFVRSGGRSQSTLPRVTLDPSSNESWGRFHAIPGLRYSGTAPRHIIQTYVNTWNRYVRPPHLYRDPLADTSFRTVAGGPMIGDGSGNVLDDGNYWGWSTTPLSSIWNIGRASPYDTSRSVIGLPTSTAPNIATLDFRNLAQGLASFERDLQEEWKYSYYEDLVRYVYGGNVGTDADPRPWILGHDAFDSAGFDIYETNFGDSGGQVEGRTQVSVMHSIPDFFAPEHGTLMTFIVIRFPPVHTKERPMWMKGKTSYLDSMGDPDLSEKARAVQLFSGDIFDADAVDTGASLGWIPHNEWFRRQPNMVSYNFENTHDNRTSFALMEHRPQSMQEANFFPGSDYEPAFSQIGLLNYWNTAARFRCNAKRIIPPAGASQFAGTNLST